MKLTYKQKLFFSFVLIFAVFASGVVFFEQNREKRSKTLSLEEKLDDYAEILHNSIRSQPDKAALDSLLRLFPQNLRLSVIDRSGHVLFDNSVDNPSVMENHINRPEIQKAANAGNGSDIRLSASTNREYIYYARDFGDRFIRVALPYNIQTKRLLQTDKFFIVFVLLFFAVILLIMNVISNRFGVSVSRLKDFAHSSGGEKLQKYDFPNDELGFIGAKITENFNSLKINEKQINLQKEKLLHHVQISEEGLCFFDAQQHVEFYNGLFVKYLNTILPDSEVAPERIFSNPLFAKVVDFLENGSEKYFETQIYRQGKIFSIRTNKFDDNSFELIINDITRQEKLHTLKQEMTGNVAHELRTPITGIRAYLETLLNSRLDEEKRQYFINQAYSQTVVLSDLISDMSLLSKMDASPLSFNLEKIDIQELVNQIATDFSSVFAEKNIEFQCMIPKHTVINGNRNLLVSIFRNLTDNSVRHAGQDIHIQINIYKEDHDFLYFSFYDTGVGIKNDSRLNRLFERFYRIDEGRTRDAGGTGLGLSIVKNAVRFHKGSIIAKNRIDGGLEFLFNLHK